jgi:hypothetical protein
MTHCFVIKVEDGYAYVREAKVDYDGTTVNYRHDPAAEVALCGFVGPRFYGQLDVLLNRDKHIMEAQPIEPESDMERERRG